MSSGGIKQNKGILFRMSSQIYEESQPWGKTLYEVVEGSHTSFDTEQQHVDLITNPHFGRMLFLDGVLQSATADEEIYHTALIGFGMRPESSRVLLAGGAEGAAAREILKWPIQHLQMVDWDGELVHHLRDVEKMNAHIWKDSRFHYSNKDIIQFCEQTTQEFDTIFLDLLDIESKEDEVLTIHILHWIQQVSADGATLVMNVGRSREMANTFAGKDGKILEILVPSFQEVWHLVKFGGLQ